MVKTIVLFLCFTIAGCSSNTVKYETLDTPSKDIEYLDFPPLVLRKLPSLNFKPKAMPDGVYGGFTKGQLAEIRKFKIAAETNEEVLDRLLILNANITENRNTLRRMLILQEQKSQFYSDRLAEKTKDLENEEWNREIDSWMYRLIIIIGGIAVIVI